MSKNNNNNNNNSTTVQLQYVVLSHRSHLFLAVKVAASVIRRLHDHCKRTQSLHDLLLKLWSKFLPQSLFCNLIWHPLTSFAHNAMRCSAVRCNGMRCAMVRCAAVRCNANRCDVVRCGGVR